MLYDLNVPWSATDSPLQQQRTISFLSELGYDTLALNHTISSSLPSQITNPIPSPPPFEIPKKTVLLRRCTLCIADPTQNHRLPALAAVYDILALRPTTEKAFLAACLSLDSHSLISLDLAKHFSFHFKPKPLMTAINRGIRFEICYSQSMDGDTAARRNFIGNVVAIVRATRGRGLVVSSGAMSVLGVRAPADVLNLLEVWGLKRERGLESLGVNPRGVVVNEGLKRTSFRGVVDVVEGGEKIVKGKGKENGEKEKEKGTQQNGVGKKQNGKRKADETNGETTPRISNRAAKKAKLKALQDQKATLSPAPETPTQPPHTADTPSKPQAAPNE
ncbi:PHP domain-like protein [Hyaloscypha variabilis F]|uniref:PHP domain-like protein n=1 Tax=Hyaloscypha variabilis (strain UAMH 11265 / GT02V1 / F) TaxID=1149755 RepID=A0A2J6RJ20_HYAVF|nr:PHP domain-like protein [Hyaloscypha variabilis F]